MNEQINLGCMNSWNEPPAQYVSHKANCGTEYEYKHMLDRDKFEIRKARRYPVQSATLGRCYTRYECSQCKCNWTVDSSD